MPISAVHLGGGGGIHLFLVYSLPHPLLEIYQALHHLYPAKLAPHPPPQRPHTKWARGVVQQIRHTSWLVTYEADRRAPSAALFQNSASSGVW